MELPQRVKTKFAHDRMQNAARHVATVEEARRDQSEGDRASYEKFHNNLALFSGGTIALSVTFLGYLKTISTPIHYEKCLIASWVCLLVCVGCSLFSTLFNNHYGFYFMEGQYFSAMKQRYETEIAEARNVTDVMNMQTSEEIEAYRVPRRALVAKSESSIKYNEPREKLYFNLWLWTSRLSYAGFLIGLVLLAAFAIANV
jgi:hypothetical protein